MNSRHGLALWALGLTVKGLSLLHGFRFPERAVGDPWAVSRWRMETLLRHWEHESLAWCRRVVQPGMTVVDAGAHIGYYTRLLAELVGPSGVVLAFEPHPENAAVLRHNVAGHRYRHVETFDCALSDRSGVAALHVSPGSSNHSLLPGYAQSRDIVPVKVVTLDGFLASRGIQSVDFVKIDVEGAEPLVLAGARRTVAGSPGIVILLEYNPQALRCEPAGPGGLLRSLRAMGLEVRTVLPEGSLGDAPGSDDEAAVNLLCCKPGRLREVL